MVRKKFTGRSSLASAGEKQLMPLGFALMQLCLAYLQGSDRKGLFFPCSGNGNGTSWNNRGSNGNYWSSSLNSATNGRNLNFNSGGVNPQNNNNRFNGFTGRAVQHSQKPSFIFFLMTLTRESLLRDLYMAYYAARRHKGQMSYITGWEENMRQNMEDLCDELLTKTYNPLPSKCFIVEYPKKREVFAAQFRDRIVHHLYYDWTHELFERTFIADSYSCIVGRGTHYGIQRLTDYCRKISLNWQEKCYVMHLDIRGYFMHIDRHRLLDIATASLRRMAANRVSRDNKQTWGDVLDIDFICWLTGEIALINPKTNCIIVGSDSDWDGLDPAKSLLKTEEGRGLPIGNLTSQLFSNVYLNLLDQFIKRELKCKGYGRYVDDAYMVSADRDWLKVQVPRIEQFLDKELGLKLHHGKTEINEVHNGVEYLGAFIKPYRTYISNHTLRRIEDKVKRIDYRDKKKAVRSINSYLGILSHTASWKIRRRMFFNSKCLRLGVFNADMAKLTERNLFFNVKK